MGARQFITADAQLAACYIERERLEFVGENADIGDVGRVKTGPVK